MYTHQLQENKETGLKQQQGQGKGGLAWQQPDTFTMSKNYGQQPDKFLLPTKNIQPEFGQHSGAAMPNTKMGSRAMGTSKHAN